MVLDLLADSIHYPREPAHFHLRSQDVSFDIGRTKFVPIRAAISILRFLMSVKLDAISCGIEGSQVVHEFDCCSARAITDTPQHCQLHNWADYRQIPHFVGHCWCDLRFRYVLVLGLEERPDFVAIYTSAIRVGQQFFSKSGTYTTGFNQQFDYAFRNDTNARLSGKWVSFVFCFHYSRDRPLTSFSFAVPYFRLSDQLRVLQPHQM